VARLTTKRATHRALEDDDAVDGIGEMNHRIVPIRVLGPVEITLDGEAAALGGPKQRAVLAMLVSRASAVVTTDELVDGIWGEDPPGAVLASVHTYVSNLRASAGYPIHRHGSAYRLEADPVDIDASVFEKDVEFGQRNLIANPEVASDTLRGALALWRGRAYADVATFPGVYDDAVRLDDLRVSAVESRIEADLNLGRHGAVVGELETLAAQHPLRESLRAKHMIALYRQGRQGDALRAFRRTQEYLREELGVDPSPELQDVEARILDHDYTLMRAKEVVNEKIALLFTEIADASALWGAQRSEMARVLGDHAELIQSAVDQAGGTVIRSHSDGFIAAFPEIWMAARAALTAQRGLMTRDWAPIDLAVRMAIDVGDIERRGGDYFGLPMNRGSRLAAIAHGGQILLSGAAQTQLSRERGTQIKSLGEHRFNGLIDAEEVYQLVGEGLRVDFPTLRSGGRSVDVARGFGDGIAGYEVRDRLGGTRFAAFYRAYQASVGREVAVKIIEPEVSNHPAFIRRFEPEARLVGSLEHPHILSIYDYWRDADGAYLVTPLMAGGNLEDANSETLQPGRVQAITAQVGSALSHAHRHGVIHGDIKPSNILFDTDGNAFLADFGTAIRAVEMSNGVPSGPSDRRDPGQSGHPEVTVQTDVYDLAAAIAYMATGGQTGVFDLSSVDPSLKPALERGLAGNPLDRPETVEAFLRLFFSPATDSPAEEQKTFRNPFKGLAAFQEVDASDFHGRGKDVERLTALVSEHGVLAVVGPSGSGKSSLVQAGLFPALRNGAVPGSEKWVITSAVPGPHPFEALAASLSAVSTASRSDLAAELAAEDGNGLLRVSNRITTELDGDLVVLVDQFEEVFTLVASEEVRNRFVSILATAAGDPLSRVRMILTLRADFFHEALNHPTLGPIISGAHLALAPPTSDQTLEAIVAPAADAGLDFEPGLPARIVSDLADQPGSLPLLQFTLDRLATTTDDSLLTNANYDTIGGVRGAIAERAEYAFHQLSEDQVEVARHIFTRLLSVSENSHDLRRRVGISEFRSLGLPEADVEVVLDIFGRERLLTFDVDSTTRDATVEVAHEALIREWPTLRAWVEARHDSLVLQRRFQNAFDEWQDSSRDPDNLLTGGKLRQYEEWASTEDVTLTLDEREFLEASVARREGELARDRKLRRRIMGGIAVAAVVATTLGGLAFWQRGLAQAEARQEEVRRLAASSTVALNEDPERAILLALEAVNVSRRESEPARSEAIATLHQAVQTSRVEMRFENDIAVGFGPDGEPVTAEQKGSMDSLPPAFLVPVAVLSPDGRFFAERIHSEGGWEILVWDAVTGEETMRVVPQAPGTPYLGLDLSWHPDGDRLVAQVIGENHSSIRIWEVPSGRELAAFATFPNNVHYALVDSRTLAVPMPSGEGVLLYDISTGEVIDRLDTPGYETVYVGHDPKRGLLVIGSQANSPVQAWDLGSKEMLWSVDLPAGFWPTIHSETGRVAVGGHDASIRLLDIETGSEMADLRGHTGLTRGALFSPDGAHLVTRTLGEGLMWDISPAGPEASGAIDVGSMTTERLVLSPTGAEVAALSAGRLVLLSLETGERREAALTGDRSQELVPTSLSPDWTLVAAYDPNVDDPDWQGRVIDMATMEAVMELPCTYPINFNTAADVLVVDGTACGENSRLISAPSGDEILDLGPDEVYGWPGAVFNPGGVFEGDSYLAVSRRERVEIYDLSEPRLLITLEHSVLGLAFDPTGRYLAGGGDSGAWVVDMEQVVNGVSAEEVLVFDDPVDPGGLLVEINADGILATSAFGSLRLWDINTADQMIQVPVTTTDPPYAIFTIEGDHVVYVDREERGHVLRQFPLDPEELIALGESRVTRGFTTDECRRYDLGVEACPPTDR
jgi:serine/threonine protein kinase/DNA-binding SARP family transcriptional activator/WD40 repeat protein